MTRLKKFWKNWDILIIGSFFLSLMITGIVCLAIFARSSDRPKKIADNVPYFVKENCEDNYASLHNDDVVRCQNYKRNKLLIKLLKEDKKLENQIKTLKAKNEFYKIQLSLIKKSQPEESELH